MYLLKKKMKTALRSNDDKRLQAFDGIISIWCKCWISMQKRIATISKYIVINFEDVII